MSLKLLKFLGYKDRSAEVECIIKESTDALVRNEEKLKLLKATLNGEDEWCRVEDCIKTCIEEIE